LFWALVSSALATDTTEVQVRHVLDGDSMRLTDGRELRLIGINAPEMSSRSRHPDSRDTSASLHVAEQPLARTARTLLANLLEGRRVTVVFEQEHKDRYGRLLGHVLLPDGGEKSAEEALLRQGLAWLVAIPPNVGWLARLQAAEDEARLARRGVWGEAHYQPRAADTLGSTDTGFRFIQGRIRKLNTSSHAYFLELAPQLSLMIPRADWERYFAALGKPQALVGRDVVARGWVSANERGLRLQVQHPAMLTLRD
jgi:endonuclease YncB( thermonuclease family)